MVLRIFGLIFLLIGTVGECWSVVKRLWAGIGRDLSVESLCHARIAATSGLMPIMFMTRVRL